MNLQIVTIETAVHMKKNGKTTMSGKKLLITKNSSEWGKKKEEV